MSIDALTCDLWANEISETNFRSQSLLYLCRQHYQFGESASTLSDKYRDFLLSPTCRQLHSTGVDFVDKVLDLEVGCEDTSGHKMTTVCGTRHFKKVTKNEGKLKVSSLKLVLGPLALDFNDKRKWLRF